jgi:TonB family protein
MPVNVRRYCTFLFLTMAAAAVTAFAQTPPQNTVADVPAAVQPIPIKAPSAAEIMRDRISKAKAFIAVRNYNAAIYELENIRRETSDPSAQAVTTVLLMNSYLEQGDYKRAQDFLNETFNHQKANRPNAGENYNAVAGQVVKGARTKAERYRSLGLAVSDRNLPLEAVTDIERMRDILELVINQAKEIGKDKTKADTAMALLEEATASRSTLARDDYDARRWRDEVADSREQIVNSRSLITNAVDGTKTIEPAPGQTVAVNNTAAPGSVPVQQAAVPPVKLPETAASTQANRPSEIVVGANNKPAETSSAPAVTETAKKEDPKPVREEPKPIVVQNVPAESRQAVQGVTSAAVTKPSGPMEVGSLLAFATRQAAPIYPPQARSMRASGVVTVKVTINEDGQVAEVQNSSGPTLLQGAAKEAVRKWRFKPFTRDGQPVKATGYVNFNFTL